MPDFFSACQTCVDLGECHIYVYNGSCGKKPTAWLLNPKRNAVMGCCEEHARALLSQEWIEVSREEAEALSVHAE